MTWLWLIAGLLTLTSGAEVMVRGASRLAGALGMPPLIIGLTVVAYGTSAPEMAVSVKACWLGQSDLALGNVVGSNTFNVLFILGLSAVIVPLRASAQLVRMDVPIMIAVSALVWALAADGRIGRFEGGLLFAGMLAYTAMLIVMGRRQSAAQATTTATHTISKHDTRTKTTDDPPASRAGRAVSLLLVLVGLALLVLGARWLVDSAVLLARGWGVSDLLIGLTIVAAGTSMPEVATSIVASLRGQRDLAIGNVVGSNIFNLLGVLGISAAIAPAGVPVSPGALNFDLPVMIAVAFACLPIFLTGGQISRWEGGLLLAYYLAYLLFLILAATTHEALGAFSSAMLWFALPLTLMGLIVSMVAHLRRQPNAASS